MSSPPTLADPRVLRRRWVVYGVAAAIYFFSYFHRVAPAVVADDLMRAFSITAAALGSLAAVYPYVFVVMALVAGSLIDTLGARWTLTLGCAMLGVGTVFFGLAPVFSMAVGGRLLVGLGASVILVAWLALSAEWFRPREFAMVSGSMLAVGNLGGLMGSTPLALLVEGLGWRETFVLIGALTSLLAVVTALVVRDRPEDMGLPSLNPHAARPGSLAEVLRGIPAVVGNPRTWAPVLAAAGIYATQIAFLGLWGVPYLAHVYGFDRVRAANSVALVAIGLIAGAPLVGWVSDRWLGRRRLPFVAFASVYAVCWLPFAVPGLRPPAPMVGPLLLVMGFASAGLVLVWACVREVNDPARVGIAMGFCNMPIFLLFALVQWLMGVILDARWHGLAVRGARVYPAEAYEAAFTLCLGVAVAALVASMLVTETRCRSVWAVSKSR